jgi:hypothetical protein
MKTRIFLTDQEKEVLFTEAQRIVRTEQKITQKKLWHQAQLVLSAELQRPNIQSSQISVLGQKFKQWQKTELGPQKKPARKPYTRRVLLAQGIVQPTPLSPLYFCPKCGVDLRTVKFVTA